MYSMTGTKKYNVQVRWVRKTFTTAVSTQGKPGAFGIGILITGGNLYVGVQQIQILIREQLEDVLQHVLGFLLIL